MSQQPILLDENCVILDTETTGLGDAEICEITIIDINGKALLDTLVKPINPIPQHVIDIHGITNEMVANSPTFAEVSDKIINILKNKTIIIYNARYDTKILLSSAKIAGIDHQLYSSLAEQSICAMIWYANFFKAKNKYGNYKWHKLTDACKAHDIDIASLTAHRAYADCLMTLKLVQHVNTFIESKNNGNSAAIA